MRAANHIFLNRQDAGIRLGSAIIKNGIKADLIAAIPRGGIPVAMEIARMTLWPVYLIYVKKIGHPSNPELAIGAVTQENILMEDQYAHFQHYATEQASAIRNRIEKLRFKLGLVCGSNQVKNRNIMLVDDGIATGLTLRLAIKEFRSWGAKKIIIAVPVAAAAAAKQLEKEVDEFICLVTDSRFTGVGTYYQDFPQLTDEEAGEALSF